MHGPVLGVCTYPLPVGYSTSEPKEDQHLQISTRERAMYVVPLRGPNKPGYNIAGYEGLLVSARTGPTGNS